MKLDILYNAFKEVSSLLRFSNINLLGSDTNTTNVSLDVQKNIDIMANKLIADALASIDDVVGYISEENDKLFLKSDKDGYLVVFDPVDGSKNVKSNITVGTIYSVYEYDNKNDKILSIYESGYCLYGPATILVKTTQENTLEQYFLDEKNDFVRIGNLEKKTSNSILSVNMSYEYDKDIKTFIRIMKNKGCTQRWIGAMVADCHQIILNGGTFIYPATKEKPKGKIRLLYEALPFSHIFSCLGGTAINTNKNNIIDHLEFVKLKNDRIHNETPIILSNVYTDKEICDILELNDIIKC